MRKPTRTRDVGRGERVLPGVWRLRLPLDIEGVPHGNAWALASGDGIVLVDTGVHDHESMGNLERALDQTGHRLRDIRLVVITHAHPDHCGQAPVIAERVGCGVWMHPAWRLHGQHPHDVDAFVAMALASGVPTASVARWAERWRDAPTGIGGILHSDRDLLPGVTIETDVGVWNVVETPGHAPSHVCLHQPERRLLVSGDHLLGRVSQVFELGHTPDPVGEFLRSLDVVEALDARLALAGHARPFTDIPGHIEANRALLARNLDGARAELRAGERTVYEIARVVFGDAYAPAFAGWQVANARAWLIHLRALGEVAVAGDEVERWRLAQP